MGPLGEWVEVGTGSNHGSQRPGEVAKVGNACGFWPASGGLGNRHSLFHPCLTEADAEKLWALRFLVAGRPGIEVPLGSPAERRNPGQAVTRTPSGVTPFQLPCCVFPAVLPVTPLFMKGVKGRGGG